jgi:trimeric autotransporter adhesin
LKNPKKVAVDALGNIYIADTNNYRIRKVTKSTGVITTVAGTGYPYLSYLGDDGGQATSSDINPPLDVAVDKSGNLYFTSDESFCIRLVTVSTGTITTVAGECDTPAAYKGDGGPATSARLSYPQGVAVDSFGNIYIADKNNNCIRMVTKSTGVINTVAGGGDFYRIGDGGQATSAYIEFPYGVAVDASGNIYISQPYNNRIRMVTKSTGVITTVAGTGKTGYSGDGGLATSATFNRPHGVAVDASGNIYIADEFGNYIRMVTQSTGVIMTLAGDGNSSYSGDGGLSISASLNRPVGVALDASGNIFIADSSNNRVRMLTAIELTTLSPASVPAPTSAPAAVPISTLSPSTVRTPTLSPSAVRTPTSAPSTVRTPTLSPSTVRTPTLSPSAVLTSTSAPSAVLTSTSAPSAVLISAPSPSAVMTSTSAPSAVLISAPSPSAVLISTSAPSTTPAPVTSLIASTPTSSSTALSSTVLPGVIGGLGGFLIILLILAIICFCRRR